MSRCVGVALTIVAAMLATGVPPAAAETEAGPLLVSGEFGIGGRTITGRFSSAKFNEYTNVRPGLVFGGDLLFEEEQQRWYLRALVDFVDEDDQSYALEMGRWGHYGLTLDYREYPHEYSSNAVTPYTKGRDGILTLPPGWNFDPAALSGQLGFASEGRNLGFRMLEGGGDAFYRPSEEVELTADYHIVDKHGTRPFAVMFGFPNFTTVASPLNEKTHTVSANARWIRDAFNLDFGYIGSFFDNARDNFTADNPVNGTDTDGSSSRGRVSRMPDNAAHQLNVSGSALLPTEFRTRLAGSFSFGRRTQDDNFLPYTVNSALTTSPLPEKDLDGKVTTLLGNLVLTSRPHRDVNLKARYRIYDFDGRTDTISFIERVPFDNAVTVTPSDARANSYTRQTASLDTRYQIASPVALRVGYEWDMWRRNSVREVHRQHEHKGRIDLDSRPAEWVSLRAGWEIAGRDANNYSTQGDLQLPQLRKFDQADRLRNEVNLLADLVPCESTTLSFSGAYSFADYEDSDFGLREDERWNLGVDFSVDPASWVGLTGWYHFDYIKARQKQISRSSTGDLPDTVPENIWTSNTRDHAHTAGVDLDLVLIPDLVEASVGYVFQRGETKTRSSGDSGAAVDYPNVRDTSHTLTTTLRYWLMEHLRLESQYVFGRFTNRNFQTDPLGQNFGDNSVYLGNRVSNYKAHVFTFQAVLEL